MKKIMHIWLGEIPSVYCKTRQSGCSHPLKQRILCMQKWDRLLHQIISRKEIKRFFCLPSRAPKAITMRKTKIQLLAYQHTNEWKNKLVSNSFKNHPIFCSASSSRESSSMRQLCNKEKGGRGIFRSRNFNRFRGMLWQQMNGQNLWGRYFSIRPNLELQSEIYFDFTATVQSIHILMDREKTIFFSEFWRFHQSTKKWAAEYAWVNEKSEGTFPTIWREIPIY